MKPYLIASFVAIIVLTGRCRADYVIEFNAVWCGPCHAQKPIVDQVRAEGCDVRPVDMDKRPDLAKYYRITSVPTCVYVISTARGDFDSGARLVGLSTAGQLRRFCVTPNITAIGSAARNAVRAVVNPLAPVIIIPAPVK